jgi:RNA recognition motif-containing protein
LVRGARLGGNEFRSARPEPLRVNRKKLQVSNLPFNVNNQDIYELFSQFGPMDKCQINYDKLGRSYVPSK